MSEVNASPATDTLQVAPETQPVSWTTGLADDVRGIAELKGWKTADDAVRSYHNLEKMRGVPPERLLTIPDKAEDIEGWGKVYERLGRPATQEDYPITGDKEFVSSMQKAFHEAGLTMKQAQAVVENYAGIMNKFQENSNKQYDTESELQHNALKEEWGSAFDERIELAKRGARYLAKDGTFDKDTLDNIERTIGFGKTAKFMAKIGELFREDSGAGLSGGSGKMFGMTPAAASARIKELQNDASFYKRLMAEDADARAEWKHLQMISASKSS